jgi:hypothetical protein
MVPSRRWLSTPPALGALVLLAVCLRLAFLAGTGFTNEDSYITLRYAENLAAGRGLVYNPGEHVLGVTTPLYALLLAGLLVCGLPALLIGKLLCIAADAWLILVLWRWLDALGERRAAWLVAVFLALNDHFLRWTTSGMESALVTALGITAWRWLQAGRERRAGLALGVLFLLRWDSLLLAGVALGERAITLRRLPIKPLALLFLVALPWLIVAICYYGTPIPTTMHAKAVVYGWRFHGQLFPALGKLLMRFWGNPLYGALSLCSLLGLWHALRERALASLRAPVLWSCLYWGAFLVSKNLLFPWYLLPPLPIYGLLAALGLARLTERLPLALPKAVQVASVVFLAIGTAAFLQRSAREAQQIETNLRIPLGLWLREHMKPNETVMLEPIGYIGYFSQRHVLDVIGLVSPQVLPLWQKSDSAPMGTIAMRFQPEWAVLRPGELQHILDAHRSDWERDYALVKTFRYRPSTARDAVVFHVFHRRSFALSR